MLALAGLLPLGIAVYLYYGVKKENEIKPELKADLLVISGGFLIGTIIGEIIGIASLFFYPLSQKMFAIFFVLECWLFPVGGSIFGNFAAQIRKKDELLYSKH